MSKVTLKRIFMLLLLIGAIACALTVSAFAEDATTEGETDTSTEEQTDTAEDVELVTENYGTLTIPAEYADATAYPWVAFTESGEFFRASSIFAYSGGILDHMGMPSGNILIFLRTDFSNSGEKQWHNAAWLATRDIVIDLMGHTFTMEHSASSGIFFGEGKNTGSVNVTFCNGKIHYNTTSVFFYANPTKKNLDFTFNFEDIKFSVDDAVAGSSFAMLMNCKTADSGIPSTGKDMNVNFNFIDSNLDLSNVGSSFNLLKMGNYYDDVNCKVTFRGGDIKGDLTNLFVYSGKIYNPVVLAENDSGLYTTNTLPSASTAPTRIFSSDAGLMTFKGVEGVAGEDGYTVYTPTLTTSALATVYGWLPDDETMLATFNVSTQAIIYTGDVFSDGSSTSASALNVTTDSTGVFAVYLREDIPASASPKTVWNICMRINTVFIDLNGKCLTQGLNTFNCQLKAKNAAQNFVIFNGTIDANAKNLITVGAITGSDTVERTGATINFYFDNVDITNISGTLSLVRDGSNAVDHANVFNVNFNGCDLSINEGYTGKLFDLGNYTNLETHVNFCGGSFNFAGDAIGNIYETQGKSNVSVTLTQLDGAYPTATVAKATELVAHATPMNTSHGELYFVNTEDALTAFALYEKTEYGYIDEAHLDASEYPLVLFEKKSGIVFPALWPVSYGGEGVESVVQYYFREHPKVDHVLLLRADYAMAHIYDADGNVEISCTNYWTGNLQSTFVIDLAGYTLTQSSCSLLNLQSRSATEANVIVKNGTIVVGSKALINYGVASADTKHTNVTFENITFSNITRRLMGDASWSSNTKYENYTLSMDVYFNGCTFDVASSMSAPIFNFGTDVKGTINVYINGGALNLNNEQYSVFNPGADIRTISFGTYNGQYPTVTVASTVDMSTTTEQTAAGDTLGFRKTSEDDTNTTYTIAPLSFVSAYLNLTNDLNLIYRVFVPYSITDQTVTFTIGELTETVTAFGTDENGLYLFKLSEIGPHRMGDAVTAIVTAQNGDASVTAEHSGLSVKSYADTVLSANPDNTSLAELIEKLLVYGASAQEYMSYNTDSLVAELGTLTDIDESESTLTLEGTGVADAYFNACGLYLDGAFALRVTVKATSFEGLTLEATKSGVTTSYDLSALEAVNGAVTVYYDELIASELDEDVTFTIKQNGEAISHVLTYSANAYLYTAQSSANEALSNLAKALYAYGVCASAYEG